MIRLKLQRWTQTEANACYKYVLLLVSKLSVKALFQLLKLSTRKLAANTFIQSQCSAVCFNEMQALAPNLQIDLREVKKSVKCYCHDLKIFYVSSSPYVSYLQ